MKEYNIIDIMAQEGVINAVKHYGIEGAEQKIREVYSRHPELKEKMLKEWRKIYLKKEK